MINPEAFTDEEGIALVRNNLHQALDILRRAGCPDRWFIEGMALALDDMRQSAATLTIGGQVITFAGRETEI